MAERQSRNSERALRLTKVAGIAGLALFVGMVVLEHALNASLSPARHQVSEYVHGRLGCVMVVAFGVWAVSLVATGATAWRWSRLVGVMLIVAACGLVVAAVWATQTSAGKLPPGVERTTAGRLHDLGTGITSMALLVAAVVSAGTAPTKWLRRVAIGSVGFAVISSGALLGVGDAVGGVRQRVLVSVAVVWQSAVLGVRDRS